MVMKLMVDSFVKVMNLISPHVLLETGSMLIVFMLKILVYLALEDLLVLLLSEEMCPSMLILVLKEVVSLYGLVMSKEVKKLGVLSNIQKLTQQQNLKLLFLLNLDTNHVKLCKIMT